MERPTLGEQVEVKAEAYKHYPDENNDRHWGRREFPRDWRKNTIEETKTGIYIGYRFVYEGEWKSGRAHEDYYEEDYFHRTGQHEVWLVVTNPRHNPIYVWPDDVRVIDSE